MARRALEDLYPLSPIQQGLLFHALLAPKSGVYICLLACGLEGKLDVAAFRRAWECTVSRHAILRTAFVWEGLDEAVQVVYCEVDVRLELRDWRRLKPEEQRVRFDAFLRAEQMKDFAFDEAPLIRLNLIELADERYQFVWTYHHMILDGWSQQLILKDVLSAYEAECQGRLSHSKCLRSYRDYIVWLQGQDTKKADYFWKASLGTLTAPTPIMNEAPASGEPNAREDDAENLLLLSRETTASLMAAARQHRLTLNTLVQGAWAFLLGWRSARDDVVFGTVVSGRPADLEGADSIPGPFINTLPVRVKLDSDLCVADWLAGIQRQHVEMRQFEYSPLVRVQGFSQIKRGIPLFESIIAFENYPSDHWFEHSNLSINVSGVRSVLKNSYPLALVSGYDDQLPLQLIYDRRYFSEYAITRILGQLEAILKSVGSGLDDKLSFLSDEMDRYERRQQAAKEGAFGEARRRMLTRIKRETAGHPTKEARQS